MSVRFGKGVVATVASNLQAGRPLFQRRRRSRLAAALDFDELSRVARRLVRSQSNAGQARPLNRQLTPLWTRPPRRYNPVMILTHDLGKSLELRRPDRELPLWRYVYGGKPKPFFHPLTTAAGHLLSLFEPHDHPWHRGLWFTI
jgi:hypothetical protein